MAATGILLRRSPDKSNLTGINQPLRGELVMATNTTEFGWLDDNNTVVWGRLENELPIEGDEGQVLTKSSDNDYDVEWADAAEAGYTKYRESMENPGYNSILGIFTEEGLVPNNVNYIYKVYVSFPVTGNKFDNYTTSLYEELEIIVPQDLLNNEDTKVAEVHLTIDSSYLEIGVEIIASWDNNILTLIAHINQIDYEFDQIPYFIFGAEYIETHPFYQPPTPAPGPT